MLDSLPGFLSTYGYYLAGVVVLCAVACYFSETFFENLKKGLIVFAVIFALVAGYELVTGKSIFTLPGDVDRKLSESPSKSSGASNYYFTDRLDKAEKEAK